MEAETISEKQGLTTTYVIIHEDDVPVLVREMVAAGMMPKGGQTEKLVVDSSLVIRTRDIRKGSVAVLGR
ncbi:hypothetical protein [uncultured Draconibacterium sp.]|uniref:hypothetical protein n=1 Tax=uncultured Draconibacterium sp. TaxID=1573823 RepID=UPI0025E6AA7C|nr:hypothetical protein [uncultured Draconibacterium sp.]